MTSTDQLIETGSLLNSEALNATIKNLDAELMNLRRRASDYENKAQFYTLADTMIRIQNIRDQFAWLRANI